MRTTSFLAILAIATFSACTLVPGDASERAVGTFEGRWDGASWRGRAYAVLRRDTLFVVAHRPDPRYFYDEYVRVQVPFAGPGSYPVRGRAGQLAKITGGDAGYFPDAEGVLDVHGYDAGGRTIAGEIRLRAESMRPAWHAEGQFHAPVYGDFSEVPPAPGR